MTCWAVKWRIMLLLYWTHGILVDTMHQIKQTVTPLVSVLTLPVTLMGDYHACKYKGHMLLWVYITVFSVLMGYCSEHPVPMHTHVCVCACNSTSLAGLMALFFSCSIFVSLMYLILIHIHRFSRSVGITNQGQDYNLDSSYYIIKGYRTNSERMNLCTSFLLLAQNIYFLNFQRANLLHATRI